MRAIEPGARGVLCVGITIVLLGGVAGSWGVVAGDGLGEGDGAGDALPRGIVPADGVSPPQVGNLSVVSTLNVVTGDWTPGSPPAGVADNASPAGEIFSPTTGDVYVLDQATDSITVLGSAPLAIGVNNYVVANLSVVGSPRYGIYDPTNEEVYVVSVAPNYLTVLEGPSSIVASVSLGASIDPEGIAFDPVTTEVYVSDAANGTVGAIGLGNHISAWIETGGRPGYLLYYPPTSDLFVANELGGNVTGIGPSNQVFTRISIPDFGPVSTAGPVLTYAPATGAIYVADGGGRNVSIISSDFQLAGNVSTGMADPLAVAYDPATDDIDSLNSIHGSGGGTENLTVLGPSNEVVANLGPSSQFESLQEWGISNSLAVDEPQGLAVIGPSNSILGTIPVGTGPGDPAFVPGTDEEVVSNEGSGTVSIIEMVYPFSISETGLPHGTSWSMTVDGIPNRTSGPSLLFWLANGLYSAIIWPAAGFYVAGDGPDVVTVNGQPVEWSVEYVPIPAPDYELGFSESGLPNGSVYWVNLTSLGETFEGGPGLWYTDEPNGTYPFTVIGPPGWVPNVTSGSVTVHGNVEVVLSFSPTGGSLLGALGSGTWLWPDLALGAGAVLAAIGMTRPRPPLPSAAKSAPSPPPPVL